MNPTPRLAYYRSRPPWQFRPRVSPSLHYWAGTGATGEKLRTYNAACMIHWYVMRHGGGGRPSTVGNICTPPIETTELSHDSGEQWPGRGTSEDCSWACDTITLYTGLASTSKPLDDLAKIYARMGSVGPTLSRQQRPGNHQTGGWIATHPRAGVVLPGPDGIISGHIGLILMFALARPPASLCHTSRAL